jgi:hypothetical protein
MITLPDFPLRAIGRMSTRFVSLGLDTFREAAHRIWRLPYGRNSRRDDYTLVLSEGHGTCSTKHALLARLAEEHRQPVELMLGIYEMNASNTPGIGAVLDKYGIAAIPEAHCYLRYRGARIDLTRADRDAGPDLEFLHEERIAPDQIGRYKVALHKRFLEEWLGTSALAGKLSLDELWSAREECVAALGCC